VQSFSIDLSRVQRELWRGASVRLAYVGSKITRVGIPDTNLNQLTVDRLALSGALLERVPNAFFGIISTSSARVMQLGLKLFF
jgi:hypothetical protein